MLIGRLAKHVFTSSQHIENFATPMLMFKVKQIAVKPTYNGCSYSETSIITNECGTSITVCTKKAMALCLRQNKRVLK